MKRLAVVAGASVSIRGGGNMGIFFREGGTLKKLNIRGRIAAYVRWNEGIVFPLGKIETSEAAAFRFLGLLFRNC